MNVHGPSRRFLRASKDDLIERKRARATLAAPREDDGIWIAEPSACGPEHAPGLVEEAQGRPQNVNLSLRSEHRARHARGAESSPELDQRQRLCEGFARG